MKYDGVIVQSTDYTDMWLIQINTSLNKRISNWSIQQL